MFGHGSGFAYLQESLAMKHVANVGYALKRFSVRTTHSFSERKYKSCFESGVMPIAMVKGLDMAFSKPFKDLKWPFPNPSVTEIQGWQVHGKCMATAWQLDLCKSGP